MSEPTTAAGRALTNIANDLYVAGLRGSASAINDAILAIEREAVAAYLASPQAAEELARALHKHMADYTAEPESYATPAEVAANILAALRDQRGAS